MNKAVLQVDPREYPLGIVDELREALGKHLNLPPESVIPSQGADQGIDLLCQMFLRPNDSALIVEPTFSFYKLRTALTQAKCVEVNINKDLTLPVESILTQGKDATILFVCSPNNPTGNQFTASDIIRVCDSFPGLIVLDEAYVEFAQETLVREVTRHRNMAVIRTFSKAFGLANLRLGFIIANPEWAPLFLDRIQYPYPINSIAANIAIQLLQNIRLVENCIESIKKERTWLLQQLRQINGVEALDSQANFILTQLPTEVEKVHKQLLDRGIATKKIGQVLNLSNCIRVTVGTHEMNKLLLESLREVLTHA
jgi:histidinol-phosphate aminotransferase